MPGTTMPETSGPESSRPESEPTPAADAPEPARDERPRPRYGEYAPVSATPPQFPPPTSDPIIPSSVDSAAPEPHPRERQRRPWDVVLTTGLLLIGVFEVVSGFGQFSNLGQALSALLTQQGVANFASSALADQFGAALNITRIVMLAVTIVVSLLLISRHRLAFWVPLVGGLLSTIAVIVCISIVLFGDPSFMQYLRAAR